MVALVGRARGIALAKDAVNRILDSIDNNPPATLASMQNDIMEAAHPELGIPDRRSRSNGARSGYPNASKRISVRNLVANGNKRTAK